MGQQPNLELVGTQPTEPGDEPGPPRPWRPTRPGEIRGPEEVPTGGPFGTTGPDAGYAYHLIAERDLQLPASDRRADAVAVLAAVTAARAARFGRGPTAGDVAMAEMVLGYDTDRLPSDIAAKIATERIGWIAGAAQHPAGARRVVAAVPDEVLTADVEEIRGRLAAGDQVIDL
jgi:hypothetical protein